MVSLMVTPPASVCITTLSANALSLVNMYIANALGLLWINGMASTLTSTTAPGKVFSSRAELAEHYKSDWHKYNLKRREAGLPLLAENDFRARWEAALALKREKDAKAKSGKDHIKNPQKKNKKKNNKSNNNGEKSSMINESIAASQENPDINPYQSLFDSKISDSLEENLSYMNKKYGFFIPDAEHLTDLEGLLGYCHEKNQAWSLLSLLWSSLSNLARLPEPHD